MAYFLLAIPLFWSTLAFADDVQNSSEDQKVEEPIIEEPIVESEENKIEENIEEGNTMEVLENNGQLEESPSAIPIKKELSADDISSASGMGVEEFGLSMETYGRPLVLSRVEREQAISTSEMGTESLYWLKPKLKRLPPHPEATTDFTAYTLEPGEVRIGFLSVGAGILPNLQISAMPVPYALGLPNFAVKVNAIQAGPLDIAIEGSRFWLSQDDRFSGTWTSVGTTASLQIFRAWSIHGGLNYAGIAAQGLLDLCALNKYITSIECVEGVESTVDDSGNSNPIGLAGNDLYADAITAHVATDIRFNRRDSLIIQASAIPFARIQMSEEVDVPDIAGLNEILEHNGRVPLASSYSGSISWQFAWKNAHLRLGVGKSAFPLSWLMQTSEFSMHFGGKESFTQFKRKHYWRKNKRNPQGDQV